MTSMLIDVDEPIIDVVCQEKHGAHNRKVRPMLLTPENIRKFWEKAKDFDTVFGYNLTLDKFGELLVEELPNGSLKARGLFWLIDDFVGMYYLTDIQAGVDAQCHYMFFDGAHMGREVLTQEMIRYVFSEFKFHRLSIEIPCYAKLAIRFVQELGFHYEGKKVGARLYKDEWFDVNLYGILNGQI